MQRPRTSPAFAVQAIACFLWLAGSAAAGQVSIQWDSVPGAAGYKVYSGDQSGVYSVVADVGSATSASLEVPWECVPVYSAVKAYNSAGESQEYSAEVQGWPQPEIHIWVPYILRQGDRTTLSVIGENFGADTQISFLDTTEAAIPKDSAGTPLFAIEDLNVVDCNRLELTAIVAAQTRGSRAIPTGSIYPDVRLESAQGIVGRDSVLMIFQFDPRRADVNQEDPLSVGRVDGSDLSWLNYSHGSGEGDPNFLADADLSGDGQVDGEDLALLSSYFGRCWSGTQWVLDESQCT